MPAQKLPVKKLTSNSIAFPNHGSLSFNQAHIRETPLRALFNQKRHGSNTFYLEALPTPSRAPPLSISLTRPPSPRRRSPPHARRFMSLRRPMLPRRRPHPKYSSPWTHLVTFTAPFDNEGKETTGM
ncbi:hypothetical protein CTI12_AA178510 [Artemisia annua]|uniref:Uncharacterized protein n=1 Tax=Artemisia annua TaxID=35608 RepID=A0A2U1P9D3_ARTAN|nr:hypothetical protein CTI12_AA178510 [Artemisia annua]